jgi:antirestriction protein ArdC
MSNSAARARPGQNRVSLCEEITNKIITELEAGRLPWVQPWGSSGVSAPLDPHGKERRYRLRLLRQRPSVASS